MLCVNAEPAESAKKGPFVGEGQQGNSKETKQSFNCDLVPWQFPEDDKETSPVNKRPTPRHPE